MNSYDCSGNDEYEELIKRHFLYPTDAATIFELGKYHLANKNYELAIRQLSRVIESPLFRIPALGMLAEAYEANGMINQAGEARDRLVRELGGNPEQ